MALTSTSDRAFVWVWLPGQTTPVPAGVLTKQSGSGLWFHYGNEYLNRSDAVSIYGPQLPLEDKWFEPTGDLGMPGPLRDGSPDGWGRRVILNHLTGRRGATADVADLDELTYLHESGTNRLGAIDFQRSVTEWQQREVHATLEQLLHAAQLLDDGQQLPADLTNAILAGSTIGGARPKALVTDNNGTQWVAKFSTTSDPFPVVNAEATSIHLARLAGIDVPDFQVAKVAGRDVLLTRRFDRGAEGTRHFVVSGLTMLQLDESNARYGTYVELLDVLRTHGRHPAKAGSDLYRRIAFNIAISNTDDHLRNHAAIWDGQTLDLTPAYDLSPGSRSGETAFQAIAYSRGGQRASNFADLLAVRSEYSLSKPAAAEIITSVIESVHDGWVDAADHGRLTADARMLLWGRQYLNPGTLYRL